MGDADSGTRGAVGISRDAVAARRTSSSVRPLRLHVWRRSAGSQCSPPSTAESRLGASSLVTAHSAREGRVCWLKRFGPSKVVTEAGLSGLAACPPAPSLPSDAWPPPPCSGVLAARRRLHDRARLKFSRTGSRSTTSSDHAHGPRRTGDKPILFIHRPTPCTPRGQCQRGHFRRLQQAGIAGSGLLWASQLDPQPVWPGPGRGGHCGGRGRSWDMKMGVSESAPGGCFT